MVPASSSGKATSIVADRVSKTYRSRAIFGRSRRSDKAALSGVSFSVCEGDTVGLLGPNGAGKTSLLKIICTMLYPSSGQVLVGGLDVMRDAAAVRRKLGLISCDERSFYWRLTGRQNLQFFAALYGVPEKRAKIRTGMLLEMLGLASAAEMPVRSYSSGMKQKLAIARGLLNEPSILLYDEPTRALDPVSAQNIRRWMIGNRELMPQQTHLIATNQMHEAEQLCDRVLVINHGGLIAAGTIQDIRERWRQHDFAVYRITYRSAEENKFYPMPELGLLGVEQSWENGAGELTLRTLKSTDALDASLRLLSSGGAIVASVSHQEATFDEVFCELVADTPSRVQEEEPEAAAV